MCVRAEKAEAAQAEQAWQAEQALHEAEHGAGRALHEGLHERCYEEDALNAMRMVRNAGKAFPSALSKGWGEPGSLGAWEPGSLGAWEPLGASGSLWEPGSLLSCEKAALCFVQSMAVEPMGPVEPQDPRGGLGHVLSEASAQLRFAQRKLFLSGRGNDVQELEYVVRIHTVVKEGGVTCARISLMDNLNLMEMSCEIELREIAVGSTNKTEPGIGADDVRRAVCGMLGASRREFDGALALHGFGRNGENVLIKPNMVASGKEMKNNKARRTERKLKLRRRTMCDLCGRAAKYTVSMPPSWHKMALNVCGIKSCAAEGDVLWVLGDCVRICKDSKRNTAVGIVMPFGV